MMLLSRMRQVASGTGLPAAFAMLCLTGNLNPAAAAGPTPWFDRDNTSGVGDFESTKDLLKINCELVGGGPLPATGGYTCSVMGGGVCVNSATVPANSCQDIRVQYSWSGGSTGWLDRDDTGGVGDFETTGDLLKIECRIIATDEEVTNGKVVTVVTPGYTCSVLDVPTIAGITSEPYTGGGVCANKDTNPAIRKCEDMKVRYTWYPW